MKKILFLSFAALTFGIAAHAQSADTSAHRGRPDRGMMMHRNNERIAKELNLTDDQKAQFDAIDKAQWGSMDSLRKSGASRDDIRKAMMANMKDANDKKRALLTPDQQTKFDKLMKERADRMKNFRRGDDNGGTPGGN